VPGDGMIQSPSRDTTAEAVSAPFHYPHRTTHRVHPAGRHNGCRARRGSSQCAARQATTAARRPPGIGVGTPHAPTLRPRPRSGGRR
jgi:hypothetical protein